MNKDLKLLKIIKWQKLQYLSHVKRHPEKYSLLQLIIQGKIIEKKES